jgi:hypothetical protein
MFGLTRLRIVEIGVALLLTLAALIFIGLTVWAEEVAGIEMTSNGLAPGVAGAP